MVVIEICENVTATVSVTFARRYEVECREAQIEQDLVEWLRDPRYYDDENYSDIFKDVWGFRPRGFFAD